jgi:hypothetical protein
MTLGAVTWTGVAGRGSDLTLHTGEVAGSIPAAPTSEIPSTQGLLTHPAAAASGRFAAERGMNMEQAGAKKAPIVSMLRSLHIFLFRHRRAREFTPVVLKRHEARRCSRLTHLIISGCSFRCARPRWRSAVWLRWPAAGSASAEDYLSAGHGQFAGQHCQFASRLRASPLCAVGFASRLRPDFGNSDRLSAVS